MDTQGQARPDFGAPTHIARMYGADGTPYEIQFNAETSYDAALDYIVKLGGGYNDSLTVSTISGGEIKTIIKNIEPEALQAPSDDLSDTKMARSLRTARLEVDAKAAEDAGFALKEPLFTLGMKVIDVGVENARSARMEFEKKPLIVDACRGFVTKIAAEKRKNTQVDLQMVRMTDKGRLIPDYTGDKALHLTRTALDGVCEKLPVDRAAGYLAACPPMLRAKNMNYWLGEVERRELDEQSQYDSNGRKGRTPKRQKITLRCRTNEASQREVFAIVSRIYSDALDCDAVAGEIIKVAPADARGSIVYDGERTRFEVLFHSNVKFDDYGVGEIFRAGVIIRTNDVGDGSVKVASMVERNLCKNLIILDTAEMQVGAIRHVGSNLVELFREYFKTALEKIAHFRKAWGYALQDTGYDLVSHDDLKESQYEKLTMSQLLGGIVWSQMRRDLVPVRGRKQDVVRDVLKAYDAEPIKNRHYLSRVDVVNAWTRYAHETAARTDPWIEDEIQTAAGRMLDSKRPLPYEIPTFDF